jgi:hypothetical protein
MRPILRSPAGPGGVRQRLRLDDERLLLPRLALARPPWLDERPDFELELLLRRPPLEALLRSVKRPWLSRAWPRELPPRLDDCDFEDDEREEELLRDAMMCCSFDGSGCGTL